LAHKFHEGKKFGEYEASRKALDEFITTEEIQQMMNSFKLLEEKPLYRVLQEPITFCRGKQYSTNTT